MHIVSYVYITVQVDVHVYVCEVYEFSKVLKRKKEKRNECVLGNIFRLSH